MGTITKDFSYKEFEKSQKAEELGILNVINTFSVRDAIKALTEKILQPLRNDLNKPLVINSGYRCEELNKAIKGVPTIQHMKGEAADVAADDPLKLAKRVVELALPFDQMILYPTFVHLSHKLNGKQRGQILYNRRYKGEKL